MLYPAMSPPLSSAIQSFGKGSPLAVFSESKIHLDCSLLVCTTPAHCLSSSVDQPP